MCLCVPFIWRCLHFFDSNNIGIPKLFEGNDIFIVTAESEGRGSTLDTLPEEKSTSAPQYKRVYSDWRPTIEKTDVVGAMEAIEGIFNVL